MQVIACLRIDECVEDVREGRQDVQVSFERNDELLSERLQVDRVVGVAVDAAVAFRDVSEDCDLAVDGDHLNFKFCLQH